MSPQQRRIWSLIDGGGALVVQCALLIEGELDQEALRAAVFKLTERHEILRTTFTRLSSLKLPAQIVAETMAPSWRVLDLSGESAARQEEEIDRLIEQSRAAGVDYRQGPLFGCVLARLSDKRSVVLINLPSLCCDTWSMNTLVRQITRYYKAERRKTEETEEPVQYAQFSEWQNNLLEGEELEQVKKHWGSQPALAASKLSFPFEHPVLPDRTSAPSLTALELDARVAQRLNAYIGKSGVSVEAFSLSCWLILLWRLTEQSEVNVSVNRHGRIFEELDNGLGPYARWPFIQVRLQEDFNFREVLEKTEQALSEAAELQEYFSWELFDDCADKIDEHLSQSVAFEFHQWVGENPNADFRASLVRFYSCAETFKLKLSALKTDGSLTFKLYSNPAYFPTKTIELLGERFKALLASVLEDEAISISELNVIGEAEKCWAIAAASGVELEFPSDKCIHELFQEQVRRSPHSEAVVMGEARLSYCELNSRANRLARHLQTLGVGAESVVALRMDRSVEMITGLLGIIKAGGVYLPIDPACPRERAAFILEDSGAQVIVTQRSLADTFALIGVTPVYLDAEWELIARQDCFDPKVISTPEMLAYIIYTSGSTGRPKGVMISHRSAANLATSLHQEIYQQTSGPLRVSLNAVLSFDSSIKQLVQLLGGHALYIIPEDVRLDGKELLGFISQNRIDVLDCTPSQLGLILSAREEFNIRLDAGIALIGGEALDLLTWQALANDDLTRFYNVYGPTECTVDATSFCIRPTPHRTSIGKALANMRVYILDVRQRLLLSGAPGEICISGAGVGRGYLKRPDLAAERFIPDPLAGEPGARMYRTGDLGRYMPDGNIEFLGRIDHQVKIRGARIELGEIEALLRQHPETKEAAVVVKEESPGDKRLVAYVIPKSKGADIDVTLRSYLKERLLEYMVPAEIESLDRLPMNRNGKVDRQALSSIQSRGKEKTAGENRAEQDLKKPVEEILEGIWSQVLGRKEISAGKSFFEQGGHSLLATQVMSRVREIFRMEMPLRSIFDSPTISGLARRIEEDRAQGRSLLAPPLTPAPRTGRLPLSFAQQRLWFTNKLYQDSPAYNVPAVIRLMGDLKIQAMRRSLTEIMRRHEVLRTTFLIVEGEVSQVVEQSPKLVMPAIDLSAIDDSRRETEARRIAEEEARRGFDLERGPMLRLGLLRLSEQESLLVMVMHHIVSDGWSASLLIRELQTLYDAFSTGMPSPLKDPPIQYADFAVWQRDWLRGEAIERQLAYWKRRLEGAPAILNIPTKQARGNATGDEGATLAVELSKNVSEGAREFCNREGVTLFMLLLAGFKVLLFRASGQRDILVGTNVANRNRIETEGMIGFFVNMLVLRTRLSGDQSFRQLLKEVRDTALEAYAHQDVPFEKLVEELRPERSLSQSPFFQVVFTLQNTPPKSLRLSGLDIQAVPIELGATTYDLVFNIRDTGQNLIASISYNKNLFDVALIDRLVGSAEALLESVISQPELRLSELEQILGEADKRRSAVIEQRFIDARSRELQRVKRRAVELARQP